jgi:hypothetical protein
MTDEELKWIKTNNSVCALLKQIHDVLALTSLPPRRKWVGLTDKEIKAIIGHNHPEGIGSYARELFKQIEAKLREKNT